MRSHELYEGLSSILYHYTASSRAISILKDNEFRLTPAPRNSNEEEMSDGKLYYLSTTRSKVGDYHSKQSSGVIFVLDGNKISNNNKGKAVDYWGSDWKKPEMEDRIFTNEPTLEAVKFITAIHVLYTGEPSQTERHIEQQAKSSGIPVFFYDNKKSWLMQNTKGAVALESGDSSAPKFYNTEDRPSVKPPSIIRFEQYLDGVPIDDLDYRDRQVLSLILNNHLYDRVVMDAVTSLRISIGGTPVSNKQDRQYVVDFLSKMKKSGVTTIPDMLEHIIDVYSDDDEEEYSPEQGSDTQSNKMIITDEYVTKVAEMFGSIRSYYMTHGSLNEVFDVTLNDGTKFNIILDEKELKTLDEDILYFDWSKFENIFPNLPITVNISEITNLTNYGMVDSEMNEILQDEFKRIERQLETQIK